MTMNKAGFSLLNFMLYLTIFSLVAVLLCQIAILVILPTFSCAQKHRFDVSLHLAQDIFIRDIRNAPCKLKQWKIITTDQLVWHNGEKDIGWRFVNNKIERIEGIFNNTWQKKKTSVIAAKITQVTFTVDRTDVINGVELKLVSENNQKKELRSYAKIRI